MTKKELINSQIKLEEESYYKMVNEKEYELKFSNSPGVNLFITTALGRFIKDLEDSKVLNKLKICDEKIDLKVLSLFIITTVFKQYINGKHRVLNIAKYVLKEYVKNMNYKFFKKTDKFYVKGIEDAKKELNSSRVRTYTVIEKLMAKKKGVEKNYISDDHDLRVVMKVLMYFVNSSDVFELKYITEMKNGKMIKKAVITPSDELLKKIEEINELSVLRDSYIKPMISPPSPWTSEKCGGFYTNYVDYTLIKKSENAKNVSENFKNKNIINCLNNLQKTSFAVDKYMLNVFDRVLKMGGGVAGIPEVNGRKLPIKPFLDEDIEKFKELHNDKFREYIKNSAMTHNHNHRMKQKIIAHILLKELADEFSKFEDIYYVYNLDFRGRIYTLQSFLTPQSDEVGKSLLNFGKKLKIGKDGLKHIKLQTANTFGLDKKTLDERIKFVDENIEKIISTAKEPFIDKFWMEADEPFQFLRCCKELNDYFESGLGENFESNLIIHKDGKCNGIQHMATLCYDRNSAEMVCITESEKVNDIYTNVLNRVKQKITLQLSKKRDVVLLEILEKIDRGLVKRNVMTTSYSVTKQGMKQQIIDELKQRDQLLPIGKRTFETETNNKIAKIISDLNYYVIKEFVESIGMVQNFLKDLVKINLKYFPNDAFEWTTPNGFKVLQLYEKSELKDIEVYCIKRRYKKIKLANNVVISGKVYGSAMIDGISPNFVHSVDASHLTFIVNRLSDELGNDFGIATIHDSFGVHACNAEKLGVVIREEFFKMYSGENILERLLNEQTKKAKSKLLPSEFKKYVLELPIVPNFNTLDLNEVLKSVYFFS